jgi:hypothetical protein
MQIAVNSIFGDGKFAGIFYIGRVDLRLVVGGNGVLASEGFAEFQRALA